MITLGETANSIQPPENKCSSQEECGQLCSEKECFSCNSFREANSQIVRGTILVRMQIKIILTIYCLLISILQGQWIIFVYELKALYQTDLTHDKYEQIPCRTAMRGSFPLNGTYFQVNEVNLVLNCRLLSFVPLLYQKLCNLSNTNMYYLEQVFADHDSSHEPISVPRSWLWNLNRRTVYFGTSIPTIFKGKELQSIVIYSVINFYMSNNQVEYIFLPNRFINTRYSTVLLER